MVPVPVYVKGGVWSNLEDQILKAAVSKYGIHQWSKIASLLQKKSARQCEIRWNEYLKPSLDFSDFSKEEDLKLLGLARKLPNQWRTIAEMMGRTAQVCMDRYNKLLLSGNEGDKSTEIETMKLRTGELNPQADTQMAIPDKEELDDDEREMLADAKERLLNTQGKKATRKIRERMLEESKRIAKLQKRRELKQAGISSKIQKGKRKYQTEIDYNTDIPYEQTPLAGIYDTSREDERTIRELSKFENNVNRKGLKEKEDYKDNNETNKNRKKRKSDDKKEEIISPQKKKDEKTTIQGNDKPRERLILSKPGTLDSSVTDNENIDMERQKLLQGKNIGSVLLKNQGEETEHVSYKNAPNQFPNDKAEEKDYNEFLKKRQLSQLFEMLPTPNNDFEILFDDEEDEEDLQGMEEGEKREETQNIGDNENISIEMKNMEEENRILVLPSFILTNQTIPEIIKNPKTEYDRVYNELILKSIEQNDYYVSDKLYQNYEKLDKLIDKSKVNYKENINDYAKTNSLITHANLPPIEELQARLHAKLQTCLHLQRELSYIQPLIEQNKRVTANLCGKDLLELRRLQQEYHVSYKIYLQEMKIIRNRKASAET